LLVKLLDLLIVPLNKVLQILETLIVGLLGLVHLYALVALLDDLIELFLHDGWARSISIVVIDFLLLHLLDDFGDGAVINSTEGIQVNNVSLELISLLERKLHAALGLTFVNEFNVVLLHELLLPAIDFELLNLLFLRLIVLDLLLELGALISAVLEEHTLLFES